MSEADLENMLLEAAGRTGSSRRDKRSHPPSKRRHHGSYSDDGSDSKDDDSYDDLESAGRKPMRSQVPLKKRSKNRDDEQGSDMDNKDGGSNLGGYNSDDSDVGSDLYKDDNDREELSKLSELEREMILSDRAAKKDDRKLHKQMRSRLATEKVPHSTTDISPIGSRGVRSSARNAGRVAAKADVLKEYKARRLKRDPDVKQRLNNEPYDSREYSPKKRIGVSAFSSGSSSESDDDSMGGGGLGYSDEDRDKTVSDIPTYEQIRSITIRRSKLAKWFMEPFFEELIVGCFVRVGIGMKDGRSIYRLCVVQNVDASDPNKKYQLENRTTYKYLSCVWGNESSAARWQMARISDSPPTLEEFNEWRREVDRTAGRMPHRIEVQEKHDAIEKINSFIYSAETVKQMLQEKKSISARPLNIAAEKEKLRRELDSAQEKGDEPEIDRIQARLRELQAVRQGQEQDKKALKLAEMNRKNRVENYRTSSVRAADRSLNPGDAGYDPFSRRWTRSKNYYPAKKEGEAAAKVGAADGVGINGSNNKINGDTMAIAAATSTTAAQGASAGVGKLTDTRAPVVQGTESNMLHNFPLNINLAVLKQHKDIKEALEEAFLEKKQRIEATVGCRVPEDDGRSHPLTLSNDEESVISNTDPIHPARSSALKGSPSSAASGKGTVTLTEAAKKNLLYKQECSDDDAPPGKVADKMKSLKRIKRSAIASEISNKNAEARGSIIKPDATKLRRGTRMKRPNVRLSDYEVATSQTRNRKLKIVQEVMGAMDDNEVEDASDDVEVEDGSDNVEVEVEDESVIPVYLNGNDGRGIGRLLGVVEKAEVGSWEVFSRRLNDMYIEDSLGSLEELIHQNHHFVDVCVDFSMSNPSILNLLR